MSNDLNGGIPFERVSREGANVSEGDIPRKVDPQIRVQKVNGYEIFLGTSADSNERLVRGHGEIKALDKDGRVLDLAHKNCLWFHSLMSKGAHVVLCWVGKEYPPKDVIRIAAGVALKNSQGDMTEVQYAALADVYKPDGAREGVFRTFRKTTIKL